MITDAKSIIHSFVAQKQVLWSSIVSYKNRVKSKLLAFSYNPFHVSNSESILLIKKKRWILRFKPSFHFLFMKFSLLCSLSEMFAAFEVYFKYFT